jgi:hypothetical protein
MLDLKVYLYRPCQRIPQYSMLLKQLLSYTPGTRHSRGVCVCVCVCGVVCSQPGL